MLQQNTEMCNSDIYLFISSADSKSYHPDDKPHTFIVELGERLNFTGRWLIALSDLNLNVPTTETLYIFCDICDISYFQNSMKPILRMIYPTQASKSVSFYKRKKSVSTYTN